MTSRSTARQWDNEGVNVGENERQLRRAGWGGKERRSPRRGEEEVVCSEATTDSRQG